MPQAKSRPADTQCALSDLFAVRRWCPLVGWQAVLNMSHRRRLSEQMLEVRPHPGCIILGSGRRVQRALRGASPNLKPVLITACRWAPADHTTEVDNAGDVEGLQPRADERSVRCRALSRQNHLRP